MSIHRAEVIPTIRKTISKATPKKQVILSKSSLIDPICFPPVKTKCQELGLVRTAPVADTTEVLTKANINGNDGLTDEALVILEIHSVDIAASITVINAPPAINENQIILKVKLPKPILFPF
ncbi:MAG: hypothetical protein ACKPH3_18495 [Dolichospermum sp.]